MSRVVTASAARSLLDAAAGAPGPLRSAARRALAALPLDAEAARRAGEAGAEPRIPPDGPSSGPATTEPGARELAARVRVKLLTDGFPDDLAGLGGLADPELRHLLDGMLAELLAAPPSSRADQGVRRLGAVLDALGPARVRDLGLPAPDLEPRGVPEHRLALVGGLCSLVHPATVLGMADGLVSSGRDRRWIVELLAGAAPLLAEPDVTAGSRYPAGPGTTELGRILQLAAPSSRRIRSAQTDPPMGPPPMGPPPMGPPPKSAPETPPTRTVHARLEAADRVAPGDVLDLLAGPGPSRGRGVRGAPLTVPAGPFDLTVTVMAEGFALVAGEGWSEAGYSWTRSLRASPADPYPAALLRLRAPDAAREACVVSAAFAVAGGGMIGVASRSVLVTTEPAPEEPPAPAAPAASSAPDVDWVLPTGDGHRPDLEIVITPGNTAPDRLLWHIRSPHPGLDRGGADATTVGSRVADVVREMFLGIEDRRGEEELGPYLRGLGRDIGDVVPPAVWDTVRAAEALLDPPPTVLLATPEPYMPWELAREPHGADPDVLGARTVIGRWPYEIGRKNPSPAPALAARTMAVVSGTYAGANRLEHAEREALALRTRYGAGDVTALEPDIVRCLQGTPPAEILHFAVHGRFDATGLKDGIQLLDGTSLGRFSIRGARTDESGPGPVRLVFLNACQLGQGREVFGRYAGMAQAFLQAGADAVVAPLWKVDDEVAQRVGETFYRALLEQSPGMPVSPALFLRSQRLAARGHEDTADGTRLAYVYFGHPSLRVRWEGLVHRG